MLYILPPPPSAKPPSVWDLIINFHRKGCQESTNSSKSSLKFECHERRKVHRSWCSKTTSESSQTASSHVSMTSKVDLLISFTFSLRDCATKLYTTLSEAERVFLNHHLRLDFHVFHIFFSTNIS